MERSIAARSGKLATEVAKESAIPFLRSLCFLWPMDPCNPRPNFLNVLSAHDFC